MKVMTILGTRPEIIRLSEVMKLLDRHCQHVIVHTGQNYDYELNRIFFEELGLRQPDHVLEVKAEGLGAQLARIIEGTADVLQREQPDAVVILGDTNSALACIPAKRLKIPVFHLEAGNRCFDEEVPEEINRRIVDHTADVNLAYSQHAKTNLLREGLRHDRIILTGSPMAELFAKHRARIDASDVLARLGLTKGKYILASIHREENVDRIERLTNLLEGLRRVAEDLSVPVLVSLHPRTRKRLETSGLAVPKGVNLHPPWGFFDYVSLQLGALCNLSDSGTIHEDAALLGIPAVVLRNVTERPETIDAGNVILAGSAPDAIVRSTRLVIAQAKAGIILPPPVDYADANFSVRVGRVVLGQAHLVKRRLRPPV